MLSLKTFPYLHRPSSPLKSLLSPPSLFSPPSLPKPFTPLALSSAAASKMDPITIVEHVVLFKVRDSTDPSKIDAMITNLRSLTSLDLASYLTAGPILRTRSAAAAGFGFTHLLHSRYRSKPDLATYAAHPAHVAVVKENVLPICDDIMAVDWVAEGRLAPPLPGSAIRLTLAKPKEEAATAEVVTAIDGIRGLVSEVKAEQLSYGENFSPARAKGYTVGFISVFPGVEELDNAMESADLVEAQKEKVRPLLESVVVVDYVVPTPPSASL